MIPDRTVYRVKNHLTNALLDLKAWTVPRHHYNELTEMVKNIQDQLDAAVPLEDTDANVSLQV